MKPAHRPKKQPVICWCHRRAEEIISDITIFLDKVMSRLHNGSVLTDSPIEDAMRGRLRHDIERLIKNRERMKELAKVYNEMEDLKADSEQRKARIERILGIVGVYDDIHGGYDDDAWRAMQFTDVPETDFHIRVPLWQAMVEYLTHAKEARIGEMESFLAQVGFSEANRQAMESALKRHPSVFKTRKQKREKYISLKGNNAPATNDQRK